MDEFTFLFMLSLVMFIGSYLAGSIPLIVSLSESKLQIISIFGAGLLVGTALSVIIPEGIRSLFSSVPIPKVAAKGATQVTYEVSEHGQPDFNAAIGLSLVLGFVVMLLVDQISSRHNRDVEGGNIGSPKLTATVGLVVHSAVDGIALGAAATTAHTDVEFIVFFAIMLHKAPAAFGLVTFLMHEGLDRKRIRKHLLVFCLSAPLLAIITYSCIGQEGKEKLSSVNATGIAMLFSAGTFLYVATVHVLPELTGRLGGYLAPSQLFALVFGTMCPLLLSAGHHH